MSDSSKAASSALVILGGMGLVLYMLTSVLLSEGNLVGQLCRFLLVAGFVMGVLLPRLTFVFWLIGCGYLDLLKRLMVVSGRMFHDDLFYVLGVAPTTFAGIVAGVLLHGLFGGIKLRSGHLGLIAAGCVMVLLSALMSLRTSGMSLRALGPDVANAGLYALLIFVVPVLYQDRGSALRLLRLLIIAWLPVMFYGVYQQVNGFQEFEIEYLKTGMSIEIKQLFSDRVRAFSTLNSPTALGTIAGALCAIALVLGRRPLNGKERASFALPIAAFVAVVYAAGMMASTVRTSLMIPVAGMMAAWAFRQRGVTWMLYAVMALAFALLVLSADFILNRIAVWNDLATTGALSRMLGAEMTSIGTFSDRLMGFRNIILNPEAYTWFGYGSERGSDPSDPLYNHDLISNMIVRYGCVPLFVMGVAGFLIARHMHRAVHRVQDADDQRLAAACLGVAFAVVAASLLSGNVLATFPNNIVFWLLISVTMMLSMSGVKAVKEKTASPQVPVSPAMMMPTAGRDLSL